MKTLTVDDVLNAYKSTGLKPCRGTEGNNHYGCAIGALYKQVLNENKTVYKDSYNWANYTYGERFVNSFITGFDSGSLTTHPSNSPAFNLGIQCAAAVGLPERLP